MLSPVSISRQKSSNFEHRMIILFSIQILTYICYVVLFAFICLDFVHRKIVVWSVFSILDDTASELKKPSNEWISVKCCCEVVKMIALWSHQENDQDWFRVQLMSPSEWLFIILKVERRSRMKILSNLEDLEVGMKNRECAEDKFNTNRDETSSARCWQKYTNQICERVWRVLKT